MTLAKVLLPRRPATGLSPGSRFQSHPTLIITIITVHSPSVVNIDLFRALFLFRRLFRRLFFFRRLFLFRRLFRRLFFFRRLFRRLFFFWRLFRRLFVPGVYLSGTDKLKRGSLC